MENTAAPTTDSPLGGTTPVVARVSYTATFQFRYAGHDFYQVAGRKLVAVKVA